MGVRDVPHGFPECVNTTSFESESLLPSPMSSNHGSYHTQYRMTLSSNDPCFSGTEKETHSGHGICEGHLPPAPKNVGRTQPIDMFPCEDTLMVIKTWCGNLVQLVDCFVCQVAAPFNRSSSHLFPCHQILLFAWDVSWVHPKKPFTTSWVYAFQSGTQEWKTGCHFRGFSTEN